jgi:hypothetical protein
MAKKKTELEELLTPYYSEVDNNLYEYMQKNKGNKSVEKIFNSLLNTPFKVLSHLPSKDMAATYMLNIENESGLLIKIQYIDSQDERLEYEIDDFGIIKGGNPILVSEEEGGLVMVFLRELLHVYKKATADIIGGKQDASILKLTTSHMAGIMTHYIKKKHSAKKLLIAKLKRERWFSRFIYRKLNLYKLPFLRKGFHA